MRREFSDPSSDMILMYRSCPGGETMCRSFNMFNPNNVELNSVHTLEQLEVSVLYLETNYATWEARTVGWLEKYELLPPGRSNSVAALRHPCDGTVNRGSKAHMMSVQYIGAAEQLFS